MRSSATLGELLRIKLGFAFKGEFFNDVGDALLLTPGNFKIGGGLQVRHGKERYYSGTCVYLTRLSILNIGRYIEMTITPTMAPTMIIISGSMIDVSVAIDESTSSS
jgi:hypothetical protein